MAWIWADYGLVVLYMTYGVLYFLALKGVEVFDWAAVLVGCLTVHFIGLAGHWWWKDEYDWLRPRIYPADSNTSIWWAYVTVDVAQFGVWVVAVVQVAGNDADLMPVGMVCLVVAYLGVVGCLGKLVLRE